MNFLQVELIKEVVKEKDEDRERQFDELLQKNAILGTKLEDLERANSLLYEKSRIEIVKFETIEVLNGKFNQFFLFFQRFYNVSEIH